MADAKKRLKQKRDCVALAKIEIVSQQSLQTAGEIELTDPSVMTVHELAPIVIQGFGKIRPYIPHIITFFRKCNELERDEQNRWKEPVESCYSVKEFCLKMLFRSPQAIYKAIREQKRLMDGSETQRQAKPKLDVKPTVVFVPSDKTQSEIEATVERVKDEIFEKGRLAERMSQGIIAEKKKVPTIQTDTMTALMDAIAKAVAYGVKKSGRADESYRKELKAARVLTLKYLNLRNIPLRSLAVPVVSATETLAEETDRLLSQAHGEAVQS